VSDRYADASEVLSHGSKYIGVSPDVRMIDRGAIASCRLLYNQPLAGATPRGNLLNARYTHSRSFR
jgi:hypothetical protein